MSILWAPMGAVECIVLSNMHCCYNLLCLLADTSLVVQIETGDHGYIMCVT